MNKWHQTILKIILCNLYLVVAAYTFPLHAQTQNVVNGSAAAAKMFVPQFFDPNRHRKKPDLAGLKVIHFITDSDYPPFHFALADGSLAGFDIDLAQHICQVLQVACTIQVRRFDTQLAAINADKGDALLSGRPMDARNRADFDFTAPYYRTPAWFVTRKADGLQSVTAKAIAGKTIGAVAGSAHEAFLKTFFAKANIKTYSNVAALRAGLKRGEMDAAFGDGISFSFWLNGQDANDCCQFVGGPFTDPHYFGEGVGIAVRKGNFAMRRALDYALEQISEDGTYTDLYLKYFPIGFY